MYNIWYCYYSVKCDAMLHPIMNSYERDGMRMRLSMVNILGKYDVIKWKLKLLTFLNLPFIMQWLIQSYFS